jgi:hypothetical protein
MSLFDGFKWWNPAWLAVNVFTLYGGGGKGGSDAPDYKPLAEASKEAARISADLGREQLAENKRQYDQNFAITAPIIQAQAGLTQQQVQQGDDYYNYMREYGRPVEQSLFFDSMGLSEDEDLAAQYEAINAGRSKTQQEYDKYQADKLAASNAPKAGVTYGQEQTKIVYKDGTYTPQELLTLANSGDKNAAKALAGAGYMTEKAQIGTVAQPQSKFNNPMSVMGLGYNMQRQQAEQPITAFRFNEDAQRKLDGFNGASYTSGDPKLDEYLASAGIKYDEPDYAVKYDVSTTTGTGRRAKTTTSTKSVSVSSAIETLNTSQAKLAAEQAKRRPDVKVVSSLQSTINNLSASLNQNGYAVQSGTDGKYAFTADPQAIFADKTKAYRDQFDADVEKYRAQLGLTKPADPRDARDWDTELADNEAQINALSREASRRANARDTAIRDNISGLGDQLASRIGETDVQVYDRYKGDIEAESGQAVADSRAGFTNALNTAARQGMRYGFSPAKLAAMAGTQSMQQAAQQAAAANTTRKAATTTMYNRGVGEAGQKLSTATQGRSMKQQDSAIATAKKLDLAGLYRGLPGASQGAYSLAVNAGNSAVQNQMAPSNAYMNGVNQGNNTIMTGQGQKIQGLGNVLSAQTSVYNASQNDSGAGIWGALGQVGGAVAASYPWSDEKVKKNITDHDDDKSLEGIKKLDVKEWEYDQDKVEGQDSRRHTGAMAQDMQKHLGGNVSNGRMVDLISAVGVNMAAVKALAKKVDKLGERK